MNVKLVSGPHLIKTRGVDALMLKVFWALVPAAVGGFVLFGLPALFLCLLCVGCSLISEALCLKARGTCEIMSHLKDGSAAVSGLLLALSLPPFSPWWIAVLGSAVAIMLGKHVYGGLGQNVFNPAMLARVVLLIAFPVEMTHWVDVPSLFGVGWMESWQITFEGRMPNDALTGATTLGLVKTGFSQHQQLPYLLDNYAPFLAFIGWESGSLGETSTFLIMMGGVWLWQQRIITWHIPLAVLGSVSLLALVFHAIDSAHYLNVWVHLNSGALMLIAFFIATDYVTSPNTPLGQIIFGLGCGTLIFVIRTWGSYPEGSGFAVLLMNACTPIIDHYIRPRIYGRTRSGKPLEISGEESGR